MKRFEYINYEMRKIITNRLSKGKKARQIADDLGLDVSAVSKEIKEIKLYLDKPIILKRLYLSSNKSF